MMTMTTRGQQAAMFLAGVAAWETLGHWWLGIWGKDSFPIKVGEWSFTSDANTVCMVAWPVMLGALVWFAWLRRRPLPAM